MIGRQERNLPDPLELGFGWNFWEIAGTAIAIRHGNPMTSVLFVSHDPEMREAAARVLTHAGCQVTAAAHAGHATLACLAGGRFDVLVIEDPMADVTAATLAARVDRHCPNVQVVRMDGVKTAYDLISAVSDATHHTRRLATSL